MDQLDSNSSAENVKIISELVEVKQWETIVGGIKTLKDEIEILKNAHQQEHNGRMADNDEEEERVDKICSALGLFDATDGFTHPETNAAIVGGIKTLKDENKKLKDEIEILKYAMDTVEEYLHGRGAMTKGFMEAVKTKAEQSNSIFFNS
tara:strand:- start:32 stop:481 length:450 start_codon:yes stop_codon:yes gene_type:complete